MATTPLITGGQFEIGPTGALVDFSDAVTKVQLLATADEIAIPATMATPKTSRRGGVKYELQIDYFANDTSTSAELFGVLWTAITTGDGDLDFSLKLRTGSVSTSNPQWTGTVAVLAASVGGEIQALSSGSVTLPLIAVPVRAIS